MAWGIIGIRDTMRVWICRADNTDIETFPTREAARKKAKQLQRMVKNGRLYGKCLSCKQRILNVRYVASRCDGEHRNDAIAVFPNEQRSTPQ